MVGPFEAGRDGPTALRCAAACLGILAVGGALGVLWHTVGASVDHRIVLAALTLLVSTALLLLGSWVAYARRGAELREHDQRRQSQLEDAVARAEEAEARSAKRLARCKAELQWTNEALRQTIDDRRAVVEAKEALVQQLLHAQRVEAMGQLTGGVAHDFNNLITAVIGNVEMAMLDLDADAQAYVALNDARRAAARAGRLTQQLLGLSRVETKSRSVEVHRAFSSLASVVASLLGEDVELRVLECPPDLRVSLPPVQLDQVLLNLVVNARDAMPDGGTIVLDASRDETDVVIRVADTGTGMDEATRARVFDPFFTTKDADKGTGLGLSTVHSILTAHGGSIEVQTAPGAGTTFSLRIPLADRQLASHRSSIPPTQQMPRGQGERVLVVEDEEAVRRIAVRMLKRLGYDTLDAASGQEALRVLGRERIDLLWTDVLMPGMDGKELADRWHAVQPDVPVLFASGYSGDVLAPRGVLQDGTNFLAKPYQASDVAKAIRRALDEPTLTLTPAR